MDIDMNNASKRNDGYDSENVLQDQTDFLVWIVL